MEKKVGIGTWTHTLGGTVYRGIYLRFWSGVSLGCSHQLELTVCRSPEPRQ